MSFGPAVISSDASWPFSPFGRRSRGPASTVPLLSRFSLREGSGSSDELESANTDVGRTRCEFELICSWLMMA